MAKTVPGILTCRFVDQNGVKASSTAYVKVDTAATTTQLQSELSAWLTLLSGVSTAKILGGSLTIDAVGGVVGTTPAGWTDSSVIDTMVMDFTVPSNGRIWGFAVPSFLDSLQSDGKIIASTGAVSDLGAGMLSNTYADYFTNGYAALGALDSAFSTGRKRRGVHSKTRGIA